jgi:transposase
MEPLLAHYKSHQSVKKGFGFLKSPDFLTSSIYLNKTRADRSLIDGDDFLSHGLRGFRAQNT